VIELYYQALSYVVVIGDSFESLALACFRALAIHGVQEGNAPVAMTLLRDGSADAGIHAAA
jgi:hypothetical protein